MIEYLSEELSESRRSAAVVIGVDCGEWYSNCFGHCLPANLGAVVMKWTPKKWWAKGIQMTAWYKISKRSAHK